ncbi:nucleotidyltransferase family protein [Nostoc sp.]|uniref:nucleotidyltransferase family protein n=1 Tax=Nostoc sp. TaxID=1180 RepID=UPI002FF804CE
MGIIKHALIMAAGRGQRMIPLTNIVPKPMAPYAGSTLIAKGIEQIAKRIEKIHVTVGYKGAMLAQHVIEHGAFSVWNTNDKSNSWWIYNTLLKYLDEPIYVLTCDNVIDLDFDLLENNYQEFGNAPCMLVPVVPVPGLEGDYIFRDGNIVTELNRYKSSDIYCSGIQIINPYKLNLLTKEGKDFYFVWEQLIQQKQLVVSSIYPRKWLAVDTIEHLSQLNNTFLHN